MCICVQSVKTCGDVIFPTIKRTIMIQALQCRKHVCVGVKSSVALTVHLFHEDQKGLNVETSCFRLDLRLITLQIGLFR